MTRVTIRPPAVLRRVESIAATARLALAQRVQRGMSELRDGAYRGWPVGSRGTRSRDALRHGLREDSDTRIVGYVEIDPASDAARYVGHIRSEPVEQLIRVPGRELARRMVRDLLGDLVRAAREVTR